MKILEIKNLSLLFGGLKAIDDLSLSVETGERLVIFGPNGAGKTSLFNVITGLTPPSSGTIEMLGRDLRAVDIPGRVALGLGRTFQITTLFPRLTVLESAVLAIQAGMPGRYSLFQQKKASRAIEASALSLLDQWGVREKADTLTQDLSYGEQRQVELVLALARQPKLLLLDEPAAGLSIAETTRVEEMIEQFPRDITLMLIEHDVEMALRIADRVIVLQQGRLAASGTPEQIRNDPAVAEIYFGVEHV